MNLKLKQLVLMGVCLIVVVILGSKFIGKDSLSSPSKLDREAVEIFVKGLPVAAFNTPPESKSIELVGIQQKDEGAMIYVRYRAKDDGKQHTIPFEIVRFDSGRWYFPKMSEFVLE
ncbi:MAG: hypothetical protein HQM13_10775 [SAR324 cluster bacterium]|nr:hypothetical protein [SAR324 cluster bacterium]